jgi:hypothetical protein
MEKDKVKNTLSHMINLFVAKKYSQLYNTDHKKRINEKEIEDAISDFGGDLTYPPKEAFDNFDIYEVSSNEFSVDFDLWVNNNKSDLTLECTIYDLGGKYVYSIDNIHVL